MVFNFTAMGATVRTLFTLEYKLVDSKGREKAPKFLGVFDCLNKLESVKQSTLKQHGDNISFHVYVSEHPF